MLQKATQLTFLPQEVLLKICSYLDVQDLRSTSETCSKLYKISTDPTQWTNHLKWILLTWEEKIQNTTSQS